MGHSKKRDPSLNPRVNPRKGTLRNHLFKSSKFFIFKVKKNLSFVNHIKSYSSIFEIDEIFKING